VTAELVVTMADARPIFHVVVWITLSYSLFYNVTVIIPENTTAYYSLLNYDGFGGKFKYLTFWFFVSR
jgi:hypothetical protein